MRVGGEEGKLSPLAPTMFAKPDKAPKPRRYTYRKNINIGPSV